MAVSSSKKYAGGNSEEVRQGLGLGATIARIEMRALLQVLVSHVNRFELAGPVRRAQSSFLKGIKELPLRGHLGGRR